MPGRKITRSGSVPARSLSEVRVPGARKRKPSLEIEVITSEVTAPHIRSPEWMAGYEVGHRDGVEKTTAELKAKQDAAKSKQNEAVLDVVRSALRMFEQDDGVADEIISWTRSRLGSR